MRRHLATPLGLVAVLFVAGCSASKNDAKSPGLVGFEQPNAGEIGAQVASYEIVAQRPQRVSVGLVAGSGKLVGYGTVSMRFTPAGQAASTNGEPDVVAVGRYVVVAGHETSNNTSGPRFISGSEGIGVYRSAVTFPQPGTWRVLVTATVSGVGLRCETLPPVGSRVEIGRRSGRVVRHFNGGLAVEFQRLIPIEEFDEDIVL